MTTTHEPERKVTALEDLIGPMAEVVEVSEGLPATARCAHCGAQAYVEVEVFDTGGAHLEYGAPALRPGDTVKRTLEFCAHHYAKHETALVLQAARVVDHRPFLAIQEGKFKGVDAR